MKCKWCGGEIQNGAKFCTNCGAKVEEQIIQQNSFVENQPVQQEVSIDNQTVQSQIGNQPQNNVVNTEEKVNVGLVILAVLIPLAGLIIFLTKKDNDKKTAKACGLAALISFGVNLLLTIISIVISVITVNNAINDAQDNLGDYINDNIEIVEPENDYDNSVVPSSNWKDYEVTINNTTLKLPCSYSDLSRLTSATMQSSYEKSYLQSGYYGLLNMYKNDKLALSIEILNDTNEDILYPDGKVTRISQSKYHVSNENAVIVFPGGLKAGQEITKDEIINLLGNPSDISNYTSDGYVQDTYKYLGDTYYTTFNYYEITVANGVINDLTLDNRNYK